MRGEDGDGVRADVPEDEYDDEYDEGEDHPQTENVELSMKGRYNRVRSFPVFHYQDVDITELNRLVDENCELDQDGWRKVDWSIHPIPVEQGVRIAALNSWPFWVGCYGNGWLFLAGVVAHAIVRADGPTTIRWQLLALPVIAALCFVCHLFWKRAFARRVANHGLTAAFWVKYRPYSRRGAKQWGRHTPSWVARLREVSDRSLVTYTDFVRLVRSRPGG